jgi:cbb3-type cytochrome oxidase subunit 3
MSVDTEFAVKRDIRNNPVLREVDERHRGELHRYMLLVALGVALFLFSAWQRGSVNQARKQIQELEQSEAQEKFLTGQIRLTLETFSAPEMIEPRALELGLRLPSLSETLVIDLAPPTASAPPTGVVAQAR